jgi:nucleotide-binding universal stress UspA family protein
MLRSILVGLDGSLQGDAAVELGVQWARRFDALLVGLGVIDEPAIRRPAAVPIGGASFKEHRDEALVAQARQRVGRLLEWFARRCAEAGVARRPVEAVGAPAERIMAEAQQYDLIMLGRETLFQPETRNGPFDTLHALLRSTPRPVVAVPERPPDGGPVLVAYDGSVPAVRALQAFQELGLCGPQDVHVLSLDPDKVEAARRAGRAVEFLRLHGVAAVPHAVGSSRAPAQAILDYAARLGAGLVVMGSYGRSTLREFFLGSVTRTLLRESAVPLFLYH